MGLVDHFVDFVVLCHFLILVVVLIIFFFFYHYHGRTRKHDARAQTWRQTLVVHVVQRNLVGRLLVPRPLVPPQRLERQLWHHHALLGRTSQRSVRSSSHASLWHDHRRHRLVPRRCATRVHLHARQ